MKYSINVALNGKHLFATHDRSLRSQEDLIKLLVLFANKFPSHEGFSLSADLEESTSQHIELEKTLSKGKLILDNETLYMRLKKEFGK